MRAALNLLLLIPFLFAGCSAFEVWPENPQPGDVLTISGSASPGEEIVLRSNFSMQLPVTAGRYEYQARVEVPRKPNRFAVTARGVQDMNLGVKMGLWITKSFSASGGKASVSHSDIFPGEYELKVFGQALSGTSRVDLDVSAETTAVADAAGQYRQEIDTTGIPAGDYRIEILGQSRTVHLGSSEDCDYPSESDSGRRDHQAAGVPRPAQREITPQVVAWYAGQIGLDPNDPEQHELAEERLRFRITGGYWRVIARGDPLTEQAGDCEQDYCLVRGTDACTVCREKEMLTLERAPEKEIIGNNSFIKCSDNLSGTGHYDEEASLGENKGFISRIVDWIRVMLAGLNGG